MAEPGEFTQRAFLNGKMDLSQAEAVADLIASESKQAHQIALQQLRGHFSNELRTLREELIHFASLIELELDFAEEDVEFADRGQLLALVDKVLRILERLAESFALGNAIKNGVPVALVGAPNTGKSTLLNQLLGEDRAIVSPIAGTTRDSVDVRFTIKGRTLVAIDTAGVRKKKSWADDVERYSHGRAVEAIERCDVAVLLLEATEPASQIEKALVKELLDRHKPTIVAINKWDLVEGKLSIEDYLKHFDQELPSLSFAPIMAISGRSVEGLEDLVAMAFNLHQQAGHRESTGRLNAAIERILQERGPSSRLGTQAKVFYVSQIGTHPPTIAFVVNKPDLFEGQYERYLLNRLRDVLPYSEVPIRLQFTARRRDGAATAAAKPRAPRRR